MMNKIPKKNIRLHDICEKNSKIPITDPEYSKYNISLEQFKYIVS